MNIVVGLPGYRPIQRLTHWSVAQLLSCLEPKFMESSLRPIAGADVSRSIMASELIRSKDFDAILFVDDDMMFDPKDAVKLSRHLRMGKLIVGGCYVTKSEKPQPTVRFFNGYSVDFHSEAKPVKVKYLAGGFLMVAREVFERLSKKMNLCNETEPISFYPFFMPFEKIERISIFKKQTSYLTEDYAFCERATKNGFDIFLDPTIRLGHCGEKVWTLEDIFSEPVQQKEKVTLTKLCYV